MQYLAFLKFFRVFVHTNTDAANTSPKSESYNEVVRQQLADCRKLLAEGKITDAEFDEFVSDRIDKARQDYLDKLGDTAVAKQRSYVVKRRD